RKEPVQRRIGNETRQHFAIRMVHPAGGAWVVGGPGRNSLARAWRRQPAGLIKSVIKVLTNRTYFGQKCSDGARLTREDIAESLAQLGGIFRNIDAQSVLQITMKDAAPGNSLLRSQLRKKPSQGSLGSEPAYILDAGIEYEASTAP